MNENKEISHEIEESNTTDDKKFRRVLITGATGAGKSSLVNRFLGGDAAPVGAGESVTQKVTEYALGEPGIVLLDSPGYTVDEGGGEYWSDVMKSALDGGCEEQTDSLDMLKHVFGSCDRKQVHLAWHCVSAAGKRITKMDELIVERFAQSGIPVAIVFTKIDCVSEEEFDSLSRETEESCPGIPHFNTCCASDSGTFERLAAMMQHDELLAWTLEKPIDMEEEEGDAPESCVYSLERKREMVVEEIIPKYVVAAAAIGAIPIPISDAVALVPTQVAMSMQIVTAFGLSKVAGTLSGVVESAVMTLLGRFVARMLAANLMKFIPGFGAIVGCVVNGSTAAVFTGTLGRAICEVCYSYCKAIADGEDASAENYFSEAKIGSAFDSTSEEAKDEC